MNIALWVLQVLLALVFFGAGMVKLVQSRTQLLANPQMAWANDFAEPQVKLIGLAEVVGAFGLIAPMAFNLLPILTPVAAVCLAILMAGAGVIHARRKENPAPTVVLTLLSLAVAAGRFVLG